MVFSNAEEAQNVFLDKEHEINGKMVEVKRAISKDVSKGMSGEFSFENLSLIFSTMRGEALSSS